MEDYKKKYEDALERAKEELGSGCFNKGSIEYIFPELVESEDEKVRKEIISALKNANYEKIYDKHIAYLEKVKDFDKQLEQAYKNSDEVQYKRGYDDGYVEGIVAAKKELEKQKPQWTNDDERLLTGIYYTLEGIAPLSYEKEVEWLKSIKTRLQ